MRARHKSKVEKMERGTTTGIIAVGHGKRDGEDVFYTDNGVLSRSELEEMERAGRKVAWIEIDCRGI